MVTFTTAPAAQVHPLSSDDVVGVVGVKQASFAADIAHATEFDELVGVGKIAAANSALAEELAGIMDQWGGEVVVSALPDATPTLEEYKAAVDRLVEYEDQPTIYTVAGDWAGRTAGTLPLVTQTGNGSGAAVATFAVNGTGQITAVTWMSGGANYAQNDVLTFTQGTVTGTYTLQAADVVGGVLQNLTGKTIAGPFVSPLLSGSPIVQSATETVAYLETVCEDTYARAVVWGGQTTIANEKAYAGANAKPRVMPAVNKGSNHNPSGLIIGAALARAARRGRGWALDGARVTGAATLQYALTPIAADVIELTQTDHAGVIVSDGGLHEVAFSEFNAAVPTDLERYWEVARQVDHVKRSLTVTGRQFVSGDYTLEGLEAHLSAAGNALARARAARSISVTIDRERSSGAGRYFFLRIAPRIAVRNIVFETSVVDTFLVI